MAPDIWFAVVALHRSFVALDLVANVSTSTSNGVELKVLARPLPERKAIKRVRDVYEHFDDYFQFKGNLQEAELERRDMHLPQVGMESGSEGVSRINVAIRDGWVDVFAAIQVMIPALKKALVLLESENVAPFPA